MHSNALSRWLKLVSVTLGLTALIGAGVALPSQAVSATPTPICSDGTCWVTFDYSGDYSVWTPPSGISSLHFDVYGAQGGRSGGKGGAVSGDFAAIPSSLYVYVGAAGSQGNAALGGFNGGGTAGSGHADQGSGGGASDIRTSTSIADRVVVAGGGGGTGGWIGGAGGPGGLTIASSGTKGATATTAGGGGTQTAGGTAGLGVTTGNGVAGSFAQGGTGGTGTVAGGGGGGGGYFGGGGGGSDNLSGGSDGAGGGGGSSFATMALTSNISHQAGVKVGNGQVVIRYTFAPKVSYFSPLTGTTSTTGSAYFQIGFDQFVSDVDPWDFVFSGTSTGCSVSNVFGDGYNFQFQVTGCSSGSMKVSLRREAVYGASPGPSQEVFSSSSVTVDSEPASLRLATPATPTNASTINFTLTSDEPFTQPSSSAFQLMGSGCLITNINMLQPTVAQISVEHCNSGANVMLILKRNQILDLVGNASPFSDLYSGDVLVDYEAPNVKSITSGTIADLIDFAVEFSEPVTNIANNSFSLTGAGCSISKLDGSGSSYHVYLTGCSGQSSLTVKSLTARDLTGNVGPTSDQSNSNGDADNLAPTAAITELERTDKSLSPSFELRFDELVSGLTINSLSRTGTAKNCNFTLGEVTVGRVFRIDSSNCAAGTLGVTLLANSVVDSHGNSGPSLATVSPLTKIAQPTPPAHPAGFQPFNARETPLKAPSVETRTNRKPIQAPAESSIATANPEALRPESWVSIAIALLALVIAKVPRGRRRA